MIFGDKKFFAIQVELESDYEGEWLLGRVCCWINNIQIGDFYQITSLRDAIPMMKWTINDRGNRYGESLCKLSFTEVFSILEESLQENGNLNNVALPETPARFDVSISLDVLSEWRFFLIQCEGKDKLIYKKNGNDEVQEMLLETERFDKVIEDFNLYLNDLHENEIEH